MVFDETFQRKVFEDVFNENVEIFRRIEEI